ncbi:hypothetical protein HK097_003150, partial [Rhizophlyctis rosea]
MRSLIHFNSEPGFRKKLKCDGARPVCESCTKKNVICTYEARNNLQPLDRGDRQKQYIELLEARLRTVEAAVMPLVVPAHAYQEAQKQQQQIPTPASQSFEAPAESLDELLALIDGKTLTTGNEVATTSFVDSLASTPQWALQNDPIFEPWQFSAPQDPQTLFATANETANNIQSAALTNVLGDFSSPSLIPPTYPTTSPTPSLSPPHPLSQPSPPLLSTPSPTPSPSASPVQPPFTPPLSTKGLLNPDGTIPKVLMYSLIETFFDRFYRCFFNIPLQHKIFMNDLKEGRVSECLIFAMCAAAAPLSDDEVVLRWVEDMKVPLWQASEVYLTRARSKSLEMMECATIDTVIALHLISTANFGCGKIPAGFGYLGMAVRMAMSLHVDIDPDDTTVHAPMSFMRKQQRRRLWHCLWVAETCDHNAVGRSSLLASRPNEVLSPVSEQIWGLADTWEDPPGVKLAPDLCSPDEGIEIVRLLLRSFQIGGTIFTLRDKLENPPSTPPEQIESRSARPLYDSGNMSLSRHQQIALLVADLARFATIVPPPDFNLLKITPECPSGDPSHMVWCVSVLHLARHLCIIFVYMYALLDEAKRTDRDSPIESTDAFKYCLGASHEMACLMQKMLDNDPELCYIAGNSSWMAFHSSIVLVLICRVSGDVDVRERARRDLDLHMLFMRTQSGRWYMAERLVRALEGIVEEGGGEDIEKMDDVEACLKMVAIIDVALAEMERSKTRDVEEIEKSRRELEECRDRVRQMDSIIQTMDQSLQQDQRQMDLYSSQVTKAQTHLQNLTRRLAVRDMHIKALRQALDDRAGEYETLVGGLCGRIEELKGALEGGRGVFKEFEKPHDEDQDSTSSLSLHDSSNGGPGPSTTEARQVWSRARDGPTSTPPTFDTTTTPNTKRATFGATPPPTPSPTPIKEVQFEKSPATTTANTTGGAGGDGEEKDKPSERIPPVQMRWPKVPKAAKRLRRLFEGHGHGYEG